MTKAAVEAVDRIYRSGFKYSKAEVLLVDLCQKGEYTEDLFSISRPEATEKVMGGGRHKWEVGQGDDAPSQCADRSELGDT